LHNDIIVYLKIYMWGMVYTIFEVAELIPGVIELIWISFYYIFIMPLRKALCKFMCSATEQTFIDS